MDEKIVQNGQRNGSKWTPILVACIGACLGSVSTVGIYIGTPLGQSVARPDPQTGSMAKAQHAALSARIDEVEYDIKNHQSTHPDQANQFDRRIATLEAQYAIILSNQGRILDRLDKR